MLSNAEQFDYPRTAKQKLNAAGRIKDLEVPALPTHLKIICTIDAESVLKEYYHVWAYNEGTLQWQ